MRKFYKSFLTLMLALIAMVANAEVKTIYTWDGNGKTSADAATISGGTATAKGGDTNVVAGNKQKNNWCLKLGKTYMVDNAPTHYVEIELDEPLKGGEEILINTFVADATKNATLGLNFNGLNEFTYAIEDRLTENGVPTTDVKTTVPASATGCTKIRIYRKEGTTTPYVSKLVITASDAPAGATFAISDIEDGAVTITPTPAEASWAAFCYPEGGREVFLLNFGLDASKSDAEVLQTLIDYTVPVTKSAGEGDFDIEDFMDNFGGAEDGNYVVVVAALDAEGDVTGEATTKTVAYVAPEEVEDIVLDVVDADVSDSEVYNIYENEDYKVYFDITKNLPLDPTRTYTLEDMDVTYSYIYNKNEIVPGQYGGVGFKKYEYTSASVKIGANNELEAIVEAKNGEDVIKAKFIYTNPEIISIKLTGKCEYDEANGTYSFTAKNKGSEVKEDYSFYLNVLEDSYSKASYSADDFSATGNKFKVAAGSDVTITSAILQHSVAGETQSLIGEIVGNDGKTYSIEITTDVPSVPTPGEDVTIDFGNVLEISVEDDDIKLLAVNSEHKLVAYITCATTEVPSGTYNTLSYSNYGDYDASFEMYMNDRFENEEGQVVVVNNGTTISITVTFKQNGQNYTVTANCVSTGVNDVTTAAKKAVSKYVKNGKVVVEKNGKKYGVNAVEVK